MVLEVDEGLGRAQRAHVGLEDAELAAGREAVGLLGHGANHLELDPALLRRRRRLRQRLPGDLVPAVAKWLGSARHGRPLQAGPDVVPAKSLARRVVAAVEAVARERR